MSLTATHTFEEGTNGGAVSSGANGVVAISGTPLYSTTCAIHGSLGVECGSNGAVNYASGATGTIDVYEKMTTISTGSATAVGLKNTSSHMVKVRWNATSGKFDVTDNAGTVVATSTTSVPAANVKVRYCVTYSTTSSTATGNVYLWVGDSAYDGFQWTEKIPFTVTTTAVVNRVAAGNIAVGWGTGIDTVRLYDNQYVPVPFGAAGPTNSGRPCTIESNTGWTASAGLIPDTMADETDTTYAISGTSGTSTMRFRVTPLNTPTAMQIILRMDGTAATTVDVTLDENGTTRQSWTGVVVNSGTITDTPLTLSGGTISAITDWSGLYATVTTVA